MERLRSWLVPAAAVLFAVILPVIDRTLPPALSIAGLMPGLMVIALVALGLNLVTGFTGLLHLGVAAFMAIGAYTYAIATSPVYPFQIGPWPGVILAVGVTAASGLALGLPAVRLRGDYLAIVTLGFGEIVQDTLRNLEPVTKGTMGINPVPPLIGGHGLSTYYLYLALLVLAILACRNLRDSRLGRAWRAIRADELAARSMGIGVARLKLAAMAVGAALCGLGGAAWSALQGSSVEPGSYDFQLSIGVLCAVIVGGLGSLPGVVVGVLLMFGLNQIVLVKLANAFGLTGANAAVWAQPTNWKYLVFGVALVLMMRFRPEGLWPEEKVP